MAVLTVNGQTVTVEKDQKLLRFLRDELHLTSVKDGCSEGACGTCTVLIDGKPTRACIPQTSKLDGKTILTVEGLSDFEKDVYTYAFGMAGAVQCGFCIPGMVMCAKALLDKDPDPTGRRRPSPSATTSAAAPGMSRSSTPFCWRRSCSGRGRCRSRRRIGPWAAGSPEWMCGRRSQEPGSIRMTCTWTG